MSRLQMNVTPQQKPGESVLLHVHSYLTLSVEGIINYSNCRGKRPVRKICVSLSSQTQLAAPSGTDLDKVRRLSFFTYFPSSISWMVSRYNSVRSSPTKLQNISLQRRLIFCRVILMKTLTSPTLSASLMSILTQSFC